MPADETLLSHIVRDYATRHEDVATSALAFILDRSAAARNAFADFLFDGPGDPPPTIDRVQTQYHLLGLSGNAFPDLACLGKDGNLLALVESKFWAPLMCNQPVTYWNALPAHSPTTLLFIAPPWRVNQSPLWDELAQRLQDDGHPLGTVKKFDDLIYAPAQNGQRRLILSSWGLLLDRLASAALSARDWQASFEIAELRGLADDIIAGADAGRDDNLKTLVREAINRLEQSGWADAKGFRTGTGSDFYGKCFRLAGAYAWFGLQYTEWRRSGRPLWLAFHDEYGGNPPAVTAGQVRHSLSDLEPTAPPGFNDAVCLPIKFPPGADIGTALDAAVGQIEAIACQIAPGAPTYRDADAPHR